MNNITLTPWFISGFTDAEGCFSIIINRNKERRLGWAVQLEFKIELHVQDLLLLYKIQDYFGVGSVTQYGKVARYYTSSIKDLINVIIPHFTKYPLHTQKGADFILFKLAALLIEKGEHLTRCGLQQIVNLKASINWGLSDVLKQAFPNTIPYPRTIIGVSGITLDWLAGFISGDGNFSITLGRVNLLGIRTTRLFFSITQHIKDLPLMKSLVEVLGCGFVIIYENKVIFRVSNFNDIQNNIIPVLDKHTIQGVKYNDYLALKEARDIIISKEHLTVQGYDIICKLKEGMNKAR